MIAILQLVLIIISIGILEALYSHFIYKNHNIQKAKQTFSDNPLKTKGDAYEKYIGRQFEEKGDLVIYNGLIKGYEDEGVDLIVISIKNKTINLIQCKNWRLRHINIEDIETIYEKLSYFIPLDICYIDRDIISLYHEVSYNKAKIIEILNDIQTNIIYYKIRKTLYASSDKVIDLHVGKYLKLINENIFRYKDMKIVIHGEA